MSIITIALIGAGIYAYGTNENFKKKTNDVGKAISELGKEAYEEVKNIVKKEGK